MSFLFKGALSLKMVFIVVNAHNYHLTVFKSDSESQMFSYGYENEKLLN